MSGAHRGAVLTKEVVARIRKLRTDNPGLGLRQIGHHFDLPISHDTIGKVLRNQRGVTINAQGRMIRQKSGHIRLRERREWLRENEWSGL